MKQIPMTVRGAEQLREELDFLKNVRRPQIIAAIAEAREHGDLKENATMLAAQLADMLINLNNVRASFTFYELAEKTVGISARSKGEVNVQRVMEVLGGGGHSNVAGAQLKGLTIEEAQEVVRKALEEIPEEKESE